MTEPSRRIVSRPMLKRACEGTNKEFQYYSVDKYSRCQRPDKVSVERAVPNVSPSWWPRRSRKRTQSRAG